MSASTASIGSLHDLSNFHLPTQRYFELPVDINGSGEPMAADVIAACRRDCDAAAPPPLFRGSMRSMRSGEKVTSCSGAPEVSLLMSINTRIMVMSAARAP